MTSRMLNLAMAAFAAVAGLPSLAAQTLPQLTQQASPLSSVRYDAIKLEAAAALKEGKAEAALKLTEPLTKLAPDDIDAWYLLTQSYRMLGKLQEAEKAAQWMLDLRPEFIGALWEAGLLREQFQDLNGSLDLLNDVYRRIPRTKYSAKIEVLTDIARVFDKQGAKRDAAEIRKELIRLNELEAMNEKTAAPTTGK